MENIIANLVSERLVGIKQLINELSMELRDLVDQLLIQNGMCRIKMEKDTWQKFIDKVNEYGGKILDGPFKRSGRRTALVQCKKDDIWFSVIDNVIDGKIWCGKCKQRLSYEEVLKIAAAKGGKCLTPENEYKKNKQKLKWKCSNPNHDEFEATFTHVKGNNGWCRECLINVGEEICRTIFELLFPAYKFKNVRPNFIKSTKGRNLELDGYNEELSLAFEHSGLQHYKNIEFFGRDKKSFETLRENDKIKAEACKNNNIDLIIIPQMDQKKYLQFIYDEIKKCASDNKKVIKLLPKSCPKISKVQLDLLLMERTINTDKETFEQMKQKIESLGGKVIDEKAKYVSSDSEIRVKCKNNHEFATSYKKLRVSMYLCQTCAATKDARENTNKKMVEYVTNRGCKVLELYSIIKNNKVYLYKDGKHFEPVNWYIKLGRYIVYECPKKHPIITIKTGNAEGFKNGIIAEHRCCPECKKGKK